MRKSGVLMPIFSLPGKYGMGCISQEAYDFVDFLQRTKQTYWQILPVGPTSFGDSPYQSFSTYAGNPYFISLQHLIEKGLLTQEECEEVDFGENAEDIDYEKIYQNRSPLLKLAYQRSNVLQEQGYQEFVDKNAFWLTDYALFMALKDANCGKSFYEWDEDLRFRREEPLEEARKQEQEAIGFYTFLQYEFQQEWMELKCYANCRGIQIIGDIPIYVAADSADVWANPELFQLDEDGRMIAVAGCPPDTFSETGQRWGNPLYDWSYHQKTKYHWWLQRMRRCQELYDVIRIDHFRGFDEYYSIPSTENTAVHGTWEKGAGMDLFTAVKQELGELSIIAEDLGFLTDSVRQLVHDCGYPGMKVLEFAFNGRDASLEDDWQKASNEYLPIFYSHHCVVYTGTHDNATLVAWAKELNDRQRLEVMDYLDIDTFDPMLIARKMIILAMSSVADTCIIPMQDYLLLDRSARINTPSTLGLNWRWRMNDEALTEDLEAFIHKITVLYGRS